MVPIFFLDIPIHILNFQPPIDNPFIQIKPFLYIFDAIPLQKIPVPVTGLHTFHSLAIRRRLHVAIGSILHPEIIFRAATERARVQALTPLQNKTSRPAVFITRPIKCPIELPPIYHPNPIKKMLLGP